MAAAHVSERRACRFTAVARSTRRYRVTRDNRALRDRLERLAVLKPRWGYRRLHWLLTREGERVNRKRVQRVYRDAGLHVRRRRRKRVSVPRVPKTAPTQPNERWSMDFMSDTLGDGRSVRTLRSSTIARARHPGSWWTSPSAPSGSLTSSMSCPSCRGARVRQRPGVHESTLRSVGAHARDRDAVHPTWQTG